MEIINNTQGLEATNPVDRVSALVNIYNDIHGIRPGDGRALKIEYNSPPENIYRNVAEYIITSSGDLNVLLFCSTRQHKKLCSWVPYFYSFANRIAYQFGGFFNACGGAKARFELSTLGGGRRALIMYGAKLGRVTEMHPRLIPQSFPGRAPNDIEFWGPRFDQWMRSLAKFVFSTRQESMYPAGGSISDAVAWVLALGTTPGYGPQVKRAVEPRDVVVVVLGLAVPMVLRPSTDVTGSWRVVGPCFVKGLMDGEGVEEFVLV